MLKKKFKFLKKFKFIRKILDLISKKDNPNNWSLYPLTEETKKYLLLQEFMDIMPKNTDIVECGVGNGSSALLFAKVAYLRELNYFAFDTFEGFLPPSQFDSGYSEKRSVYKFFTIDYVKENLLKAGLSKAEINKINFIKGDILETAISYKGCPGLVLVDLDLYEPIKFSLDYFYEKLPKGGLLICDEYDSEKELLKWPGAKIAVDEFAEKYGVNLNRHWTGKVFFIKE